LIEQLSGVKLYHEYQKENHPFKGISFKYSQIKNTNVTFIDSSGVHSPSESISLVLENGFIFFLLFYFPILDLYFILFIYFQKILFLIFLI